MTQKVSAHMILRQLQKRHQNDLFYAEVKNGPTWTSNNLLKLDALAIKKSWTNQLLTGYEVKVARSDFVRDEKWPGYLAYCHKFYFVCPVGLIDKTELPEKVGLMYYNPGKGTLSIKRHAVYQDIEISKEMLYYLLICRTSSDRYPFFSSQREQLEAWVQDKISRRELGNAVRNKMLYEIRDQEKQIENLKRELKSREYDSMIIGNIRKILVSHGININHWGIEKSLEDALKQGMPPKLFNGLQNISREVNSLMDIVKQGDSV